MSFLVLALLAVATRGASAQHPNRHGSKVPAKAIPLPVKFPVVDSDGQIKQIDLELDLPALAAAAGAGGAAQRSDRGGPRRGREAVARGESGASYASVYEYTSCRAEVLVRPNSTEAVAAAVRDLLSRAKAEGRPLKLRATHNKFGSTASFPCAQGAGGTNGTAPLTAAVLVDAMNRVVSMNRTSGLARIQPALNITAFLKAATRAGLSVPRLSLPAWGGLTLGGIVATSAHGAGYNVTSTICSVVTRVTWVDGNATVHDTPASDPVFNGICGGIGLLGVITEIELQLAPASNTLLQSQLLKPDANLAADIDELVKKTPNLVVVWRPDAGVYSAVLQSPAPAGAKPTPNVSGSSFAAFTPPRSTVLIAVTRALQGDPGNHNPTSLPLEAATCPLLVSASIASGWASTPAPPGLDSVLPQVPFLNGVAGTNDVITSDCGENCVFVNPEFDSYFLDMELAIERSSLPAWIADMRSIIAKDLKGLPGLGSSKRCLPGGTFIIRFGQTNDYNIAMSTGLKEPVYVQHLVLTARTDDPTHYIWILELFEQLTLVKYNGRPHWGKNLERTFTDARSPMSAKYTNGGITKMAALQDQFDPARVFEPPLWGKIVRQEAFTPTARCATRYQCFCSADSHCADNWRCVPAQSFPQFHVCKPKTLV